MISFSVNRQRVNLDVRFGFPNLRHSLASFLIRMRTDPKTVQTLLRHSDH